MASAEVRKSILQEALVSLDKTGWCQGQATDARGRHCAIGLVDAGFQRLRSQKSAHTIDELADAVGEVKDLLRVKIGSRSISQWNDAPGRTVGEVKEALRAAISIA